MSMSMSPRGTWRFISYVPLVLSGWCLLVFMQEEKRMVTLSSYLRYSTENSLASTSDGSRSVASGLASERRSAAGDEDETTPRPRPVYDANKPNLILHIGPMKTGTTTIQMNVLRNRKLIESMQADGMSVVETFNYKKFPKLRNECLEKEKMDDCDRKQWDKLIQSFDNALESNNATRTVIHSCEEYAGLPDNNVTRQLLRGLQTQWNVKVVSFYRRPHAWFPSFYHQMRKTNHFDSSRGRYRDFPDYKVSDLSPQDYFAEQPTMPSYFEKSYFSSRDSLDALKFYDRVFGVGSTHTLDFQSPRGLAVEFACDGLDLASIDNSQKETVLPSSNNNTCHEIQNLKVKAGNAGATFFFDEDFVILKAHRQGFFQGPHFKRRRDLVLSFREQLAAWNMTVAHDLPQTCLNERQENMLWERAVEAETLLSSSPLSKDDLRKDFERYLPKLCSVDATAILANETWRSFFNSSCIFRTSDSNDCDNEVLIS